MHEREGQSGVHIDLIRRRIKSEPFEPFVIHMTDGRRFAVRHPELLHAFPGIERTVVLGLPDEQAHEIIDVLHVASLSISENGQSRGSGD